MRWAQTQHDIVCNQKYDKTLPYSFHLSCVFNELVNYIHNTQEDFSETDMDILAMGAMGHDLIEDARVTYNDIANKWGFEVADVIYACTELRGKTRAERHGPEYIETLQENFFGRIVKLCDILTNTRYSKNSGSSMFKKYKKEYEHSTLPNLIQNDERLTYFKNEFEKLLNV